MAGTLYLVATPIGNLEDITLRALRVLGEVDLIACEDTRHTKKLLSHFQISKPTVSYHEHNERERALEVAAKLEEGANVALVSDAGMPLVSDPGYRLVSEAISRNIPVVPIPGPSALTSALAASGLAPGEFFFAGFLPPKRAARRARLAELKTIRATLVFYEAPHRIHQTLGDALDTLGDRRAVIAREMTKLHEEFLRGSLSHLASRISEKPAKGEMVLLVGPPSEDNLYRDAPPAKRSSILEEVESLMRSEGIDRRGALKRVARARGITRSQAYRLLLDESREDRTR
jgi:16S rRNA (cytidine1402-2'-O)-methyltransferase